MNTGIFEEDPYLNISKKKYLNIKILKIYIQILGSTAHLEEQRSSEGKIVWADFVGAYFFLADFFRNSFSVAGYNHKRDC